MCPAPVLAGVSMLTFALALLQSSGLLGLVAGGRLSLVAGERLGEWCASGFTVAASVAANHPPIVGLFCSGPEMCILPLPL